MARSRNILWTYQRQLTALLWKQIVLRWRCRTSFIMQLIQPLFFVVVIWLVDKAVIQSQQRLTALQSGLSAAAATLVPGIPLCTSDKFLRKGVPCYTLLYSPVGERAIDAIVEGIRVNNDPPIPVNQTRGFATMEQVDAYLHQHPETTLAAVHFEYQHGNERTNATLNWHRGLYQHPNSYVQIPLQVAVERETARWLSGDTELPWNVSLALFPRPAVEYPSQAGLFAPTFLFAAAMFNFVLLLQHLVHEKESGMLAMLHHAGMRRLPFWLSWAVLEAVASAVCAITAVGVGVALDIPLFDRNAVSLTFLLLFLAFLALNGLAFWVSTLLRHSHAAVPVGFTLFIVAWIYMVVINFGFPYSTNYDVVWSVLFSLVPWSLLGKGVKDLAQATTGNSSGLTWSQRFSYCVDRVSPSVSLNSPGQYYQQQCRMSVGTIYYLLAAQYAGYTMLALWFDHIRPPQGVLAHKWYFFLLPSYWLPQQVDTRKPGPTTGCSACLSGPACRRVRSQAAIMAPPHTDMLPSATLHCSSAAPPSWRQSLQRLSKAWPRVLFNFRAPQTDEAASVQLSDPCVAHHSSDNANDDGHYQGINASTASLAVPAATFPAPGRQDLHQDTPSPAACACELHSHMGSDTVDDTSQPSPPDLGTDLTALHIERQQTKLGNRSTPMFASAKAAEVLNTTGVEEDDVGHTVVALAQRPPVQGCAVEMSLASGSTLSLVEQRRQCKSQLAAATVTSLYEEQNQCQGAPAGLQNMGGSADEDKSATVELERAADGVPAALAVAAAEQHGVAAEVAAATTVCSSNALNKNVGSGTLQTTDISQEMASIAGSTAPQRVAEEQAAYRAEPPAPMAVEVLGLRKQYRTVIWRRVCSNSDDQPGSSPGNSLARRAHGEGHGPHEQPCDSSKPRSGRRCSLWCPGFQYTEAVKSTWLSMRARECLCLTGHNGAGKTTFLKCLTGSLRPSEGTAVIGGLDISSPGSRTSLGSVLGICPQYNALWSELSIAQHMHLYAAMHGMTAAEAHTAEKHLLQQVGLYDVRQRFAGQCSGGMQRRLSVALAMLGNPVLLVLDEPSSSLDPVSRQQLWQLLRSIKQQGCAILLTTHDTLEAQALADRTATMTGGELHIDSVCGASR